MRLRLPYWLSVRVAALGLVASAAFVTAIPASAYSSPTSTVHITASGSMHGCDNDGYCITAVLSESAYAKQVAHLVCGSQCYWGVSPTQLEQYVYDPNHYFDQFLAPFSFYRYVDLYDAGQVYKTYSTAPQSGLCWSVIWDPNNYYGNSGCNTFTYQLPYEGSIAGYGNFHASVYPDPGSFGGIVGSSGLFRLN